MQHVGPTGYPRKHCFDHRTSSPGEVCESEHVQGGRERADAHGRAKWATVLVTGATGHIGRHFCELIESKGVGTVRVSRALGFDISLPMFGLAEARYRELRAECDAVVHCAAVVN